MTYYTIPPSLPLAPYVRCFWVLESEVSAGDPYIYRGMADGCPEMVFHYKGRFDELTVAGDAISSFTAGIHGQSQQYSRFRIHESFGIFGAYLYPYAIPVLFNMPASELSNQMPDLVTLLGQPGKDLEEQIMTAPGNRQRHAILTAFLEQRLAKSETCYPAVFSAVHHIIQTKGTVRVDELAGQYFLSTRQFERNFKAFSGFSPKLYSRIIRFQAALREYGNKDKSLTEIAYDCGYYDQSHFIHEFKMFSGHHPRQFFYGQAEGTEWRS